MRRVLREASVRPLSRIGRVLALAIGLCAFGFSIVGHQLDSGYADDRVRLNGNHPAQAEAFTPLGDAALDAPLEMQIRFALRNQAVLDQLLADQQNPASERYHKWLKTGEFFRRFGPSSSEVQALEGWLKSEGFIITSRAPGYLEFKGNVAQAQHAFDVRIARFGDGSVYANTSDPVVPQRFAGVIGAILGMDNMVRAVPVTHQPALSANAQSRPGYRRAAGRTPSLRRPSAILRKVPVRRRLATPSSAGSRLSVPATCALSMTKPSVPDATAPATVSRSSASRTFSIRP